MVEIWLPYGSSDIPVRVPDERLIDILETKQKSKPLDAIAKAKELIEADSLLHEAAAKAQRICVAVGPCGNGALLGDLIESIVQELSKDSRAHVTILCTHGAPELEMNPSAETTLMHHDPDASSTLPLDNFNRSLTPELNAEFLRADLRIIVGELRPHPFLECAGLCDIIFPGLASSGSVRGHLSDRTGVSMFDLRKERLSIADTVGNVFALGVVLDSGRQPAEIRFGTVSDSFSILREDLKIKCVRTVAKAADILIMSAGGSPQDESLLEAVETFAVGLGALKKNGALIVTAECGNGHGDTEFYEWCAEKKEPHHLEARLRHRFNFNGFKAAFLQRTLQSHRIYLVSTVPDYYIETIFGMKSAPTVNAALQTAQRALGSDSTISVVPDASRIIIRPHSEGSSEPSAKGKSEQT